MFERSLARVLWTLPTRLIGLKFLAFTAPSFFRMSAIEVAFKNLSKERTLWCLLSAHSSIIGIKLSRIHWALELYHLSYHAKLVMSLLPQIVIQVVPLPLH